MKRLIVLLIGGYFWSRYVYRAGQRQGRKDIFARSFPTINRLIREFDARKPVA